MSTVLLVREGQGSASPDWLVWAALGSGAALLSAALVAVVTWPDDEVGFWDNAGSGGFGIETAASFGWYVVLVAGVLAGTAGVLLCFGERDTEVVMEGPGPG